MLTLDALAAAQLLAETRGAPLLAEFDFLSGTQYYSSWGDNLTIDGHLYIGLAGLVGISGLQESDDLAARSLTFTLTIVNDAILASVIGSATEYRRREARLYLQLIDPHFQPVGAKLLRWRGFMDKVTVDRSPPKTTTDGAGSGSIQLLCSRAGVPMSRRAIGIRSTDEQQKLLYPTDRFLEFQKALVEKPTLWLSKKFQRQ